MIRLTFLVFLAVTVLKLQAQKFEPIDEQSEIKFGIRNFGITVEGKLSGLSGEIGWNPNQLDECFFNVSVLTASLTTGIALRDRHLKKEEFFNANVFPLITFNSTTISKSAVKDAWMATGRLTIKKVCRTYTIPFTVSSKGSNLDMTGHFVINRADFGIGSTSLSMADEVEVSLAVRLRQVDGR